MSGFGTSAFGASTKTNTGAFGATTGTSAFGATNTNTSGFGGTSAFGTGGTTGGTSAFGTGGTGTTGTSAFGTGTSAFGTGTTSGFGTGGTSAFGTGGTTSAFGTGGTSAFGTGGTTSAFGTGGTSAFGTGGTTSAFGTGGTTAFGGGGGSPFAQNELDAAMTRLEKAYTPRQPGCRFQNVFYNLKPANTHVQIAPELRANTRLCEQAIRNNPDPEHLVPVLAEGFEEIKKRLEVQDKFRKQYEEQLRRYEASIDELQAQHEAKTKGRIAELQRNATKLSSMLLRVMSKLQRVQAADLPISNDEFNFRRQLEALNRRRAGFQSRLDEQTASAKAVVDRQPDSLTDDVDPSDIRRIYEFLEYQRKGLHQLSSVLKKDIADINLVTKGLRDGR